MSLTPILRDVKVARFINPILSPLENLIHKIFENDNSDDKK